MMMMMMMYWQVRSKTLLWTCSLFFFFFAQQDENANTVLEPLGLFFSVVCSKVTKPSMWIPSGAFLQNHCFSPGIYCQSPMKGPGQKMSAGFCVNPPLYWREDTSWLVEQHQRVEGWSRFCFESRHKKRSNERDKKGGSGAHKRFLCRLERWAQGSFNSEEIIVCLNHKTPTSGIVTPASKWNHQKMYVAFFSSLLFVRLKMLRHDSQRSLARIEIFDSVPSRQMDPSHDWFVS